jgi:glucosyl-3-phosphoglycerate synthase
MGAAGATNVGAGGQILFRSSMDRVEQWLASRTFHHRQFSDVRELARLKEQQRLRVSLCIPTLNEARTIGAVTAALRPLRDDVGLLDEIAVIDSDSQDQTLALAAAAGADVYLAADILPAMGRGCGKGENLWKAVHQLQGDLLVFIDGDVANMHPRFVAGLVGPLLRQPEIGYVKACYQRSDRAIDADGDVSDGGRVTEILVRPLLSLHFPELTGMIQPLAGEYAARRSLLEQLAFPVGYGVELAHLIDLWTKHGLSVFAQTDMDQRRHRRRSNQELGRMAAALLQTFNRRLAQPDGADYAASLQQFTRTDGEWLRQSRRIVEFERPPLAQVPAYWLRRTALAASVGQAEPAALASVEC